MAASDRHPRGRLRGATAAFVAEVAAGTPICEAAHRAGMSERTGRRRMEDPEVRAHVRAARDRLLDVHLGRLTRLTDAALDTLTDLLACKNDPVRLGAARAVLEHRMRLEQQQDLSARVAALEQAASLRTSVDGRNSPLRATLQLQANGNERSAG